MLTQLIVLILKLIELETTSDLVIEYPSCNIKNEKNTQFQLWFKHNYLKNKTITKFDWNKSNNQNTFIKSS